MAAAKLFLTGPAESSGLAETRRRLSDWLDEHAVPTGLRTDIVQVAGEALANAVEHAYQHGVPGSATLTATASDDSIVIAVSDRGRWRPPHTSRLHRGRGLPIMRALAEQLELRRDPDGTTVIAHFPMPRQPKGVSWHSN